MSIQITGGTTGIVIPDDTIPARTLKTNAEILRSQMKQVAFNEHPISLTLLRTWDALQANLPGSAAADDLALITGTPGTDRPKIQAGDVGGTATSRKAAFILEVPDNWDDGQSLQVRINAGMEDTVADTSCTVDLQAWLPSAPTTDVVSTSAQSMNSLTAADLDFDFTITNIDPSNWLLCVITIAYSDASANVVTPTIYSISRRCDTRG